MIKGIDVSRWQGNINWPMVKQNVDFAIIKIGGSDDGFYMDGQAVRNVLEARSAGLPIGFYVYLGGAFSVAEEVQHIKNLISNIGGLKGGEPFCLDWEENHADEVGYVTGIAKGLIDVGVSPPMIYMSLSRVRGNDWRRLVDLNCSLWVAAWGNNDATPDAAPPSDEWPFWAVWQYSSTGTVAGIGGRVDLNLFQGDVETFKKYGARSLSLPTNRPVQMPTPSRETTVEHIIRAGENLSTIAEKYGMNWQQLWALNRDRVSNPNRIYPNQKLRVPGTPAAPVALPTTTHVAQRIHTVQNGENLSVIASAYGLPSWSFLYEANRDVISDPNLIRPGQRLRIP